MRGALVLRPEPGNARTVARLAAVGVPATALPLFAVEPRDWTPPTAPVDALLLTSANAVRHAGPGLAALAALPVIAVGSATAAAARAAGLHVAVTGTQGVEQAVSEARAYPRLLHLAGADHRAVGGAITRIVYASIALDLLPAALDQAIDRVVLLHSPRAARRFAALFGERDRAQVRLAALSTSVARAAGDGWAARALATRPTDDALVPLAATLAIDP